MADSVKLPKPRFGQIVVLQKNGDEPRGHGFPLIGRDCVIGRSEDADIRISSADVSLIHCKIVVEEETGECSLEVHGRETELNGNIIDPVATVKLLHRDVVLIGGRRLRFEYLPPDYKPMPSKNFAKKHQQIALDEKEEEEKEGHLRAEVVDNDEVADEDEQKQQQDCAGSNSSKSEDESTDCGDSGSAAPIVPDLMSFTPSTTTVSKRVSFGPYLSPEQFDNTLPPATPVKRGATPRTSRRYSGLKFTRSSSIAPLVEEVAAEATAEQGGEDQQQFNKEEEIKKNIAPPPLDESTMQSADGTDAMSTISDVSNTAVVPSECTSFLDDDITTDVDPTTESQQQDEDEDYGGSCCSINNATKGDNDSTVDQVLASDSDQDEEFYEPSVVADGDESITCQQHELPLSQTATDSISIDNQDDEEKENKLNDVSSSAAPLPIDEQGALEKKDSTEDDDEELFQSPARSVGSLSPVKAPIGGGSNIGDETRLLLSPPGTSSLGAIADSTALELQLLQTPKAVAGASSTKEGRKSARSAAVVAAAKISNTPKADYVTNVAGIKKLMQTPKVVPETPKADYTDVRGVKRLLKTPSAATPETPKADYVTNVDEGMKKLLKTPKSQAPSTPKADYTNVEGVKKLMQTPKPGQAETPKADYRDVSGMKRLLRTLKVATTTVAHATPKADYVSNVDIGMKKLLATPRPLPQTPKGDYVTNVEGIERLMKTPLVMKDDSSDISGEEVLAKTATEEEDKKQVTGVLEGSQQPTLAGMDLDGGEMCSGKENGIDDSKSPVIDSDCHTPAEGEIDSVAAVPATAESTPSTNVASGLPVVISPQSETDTACIQPKPSDNEPFLADKADDDVEETLIPSIAANCQNKIDEENDVSACSSTDPHSAASPPLVPLNAANDADESSTAKVQLVHQADDPSIVDVVKTPALTRRGRAASASNAATPCLSQVTVTELNTPSNKRGRRRDRSASTEEEETESQLPPTAAVAATPVQHRRTKTSGGRVATPTVASNASGSVSSTSKASRSAKRSRLMQQPTLPSVADDADDGNTCDDVTAAEASALKEEAGQQQLENPNIKTFTAIGGEGVLISDQIAKEPMEQKQSQSLQLVKEDEHKEAAVATVISDDGGAQSPTATSEQQPTIALSNDEKTPAIATPAVSGRRCTPRRPLAESMTHASATPSTPSTLPILEAADETEEEVEVKKLSSSGILTEDFEGDQHYSSANDGESKKGSLDFNSPASVSPTVDEKSDKEDGGGELEALTTSTETETEDGSTGTYNNEPNPVPSTPKSSSSRSTADSAKKTPSSLRKERQTTATPRSSGRGSSRSAASSSKRTASTMDEATEVEEELPIVVSDLKEQGEMEIDNSTSSVGIGKTTTATKRRRETAETTSAATPTAPSTPLRASSRAATVAAAKSRAQAQQQQQSPVPTSSSRTSRRGAVVSKQPVASASVPSSDEDNNEKKMEEEDDSEMSTRSTRTTGAGRDHQSKAPAAASKSKAKPRTISTSKKQQQQFTPVDDVADNVAVEDQETEEVIEPPPTLAPSAGRAKRSSKKEKAQMEEHLTTDASQPLVQAEPVVRLTRCAVPTSCSADSSPPPSSKRSSKRTAAEQQQPVQKALEVKAGRGRRKAAASTAELMSDDSMSSVVSSSSTMTPTASSEVGPSAGSRKRSNKETKVTTTELVASPSEQQQSASKRTRRTATATAPSQKEKEEEPMEVVVEEDEPSLPATPLADKKKKQKEMKSTTPSRSSQKKTTKAKNVHFASDFDNDNEQDQVSPSPPLRKTRGGRGAAAATNTAKGKGKSTTAGDKKTIAEVKENDNSNQGQDEDDVDEDALPPQRQTRTRGAVTKSSGGVEENKTKVKGKSSKVTSKQPLKKGRAASAPSSSSSDENEDLKQLQQEKKKGTTAGHSESEDDKVEMEEELTSPQPVASNSKAKAKSAKVTTAGSNSKSKSKTKSTTGTKSAVASPPPSPQVVAPPSPRRTRRTRNN